MHVVRSLCSACNARIAYYSPHTRTHTHDTPTDRIEANALFTHCLHNSTQMFDKKRQIKLIRSVLSAASSSQIAVQCKCLSITQSASASQLCCVRFYRAMMVRLCYRYKYIPFNSNSLLQTKYQLQQRIYMQCYATATRQREFGYIYLFIYICVLCVYVLVCVPSNSSDVSISISCMRRPVQKVDLEWNFIRV